MSYGAPSSPREDRGGIRIEREPRAVVVKRHDAVMASTERALIVHGVLEGPVYYVPQEDVYMEHLTESLDQKAGREGHGRRFFSVTASGGGVADAAWVHTGATGDLAPLHDHIGFDPAIFSVTAG